MHQKVYRLAFRGNTRTLDWLDSSYELGYEIITKDQYDEYGVEKCIEMIQERVGDAPIYITFDLDCLDVTVAPGVSNLEPAIEGFKMPDVLQMLQGLRGKMLLVVMLSVLCQPLTLQIKLPHMLLTQLCLR